MSLYIIQALWCVQPRVAVDVEAWWVDVGTLFGGCRPTCSIATIAPLGYGSWGLTNHPSHSARSPGYGHSSTVVENREGI